MTRAVLDANVLVSALISPAGPPASILDLWHQDQFVVVVSEPILAEVERVLRAPRLSKRYRLTPSLVKRLMRGLRQFASMTPGKPVASGVARDPEDDAYLACAAEGEADYLVTGDQDLLSLREYQGISIVSPVVFLRLLEQRRGG
jgi:hypothetical protein